MTCKKAAIFFGYGWWGDASPPIPNGVSAPAGWCVCHRVSPFNLRRVRSLLGKGKRKDKGAYT